MLQVQKGDERSECTMRVLQKTVLPQLHEIDGVAKNGNAKNVYAYARETSSEPYGSDENALELHI